ncbi:MAG TPA: hypothetical protein VMM13_00575 [Euzebya sp.]|nr:hypothetical protein [Euzebya sp.]
MATTVVPARPPQPRGDRVAGHARLLLRDGLAAPEIEAMFATHGDAMRLRMGPPPIARYLNLFRTPQAVHDVLAGQDSGFTRDDRARGRRP